MWRGNKTIPRPQEFYRAANASPSPGFEILEYATAFTVHAWRHINDNWLDKISVRIQDRSPPPFLLKILFSTLTI